MDEPAPPRRMSFTGGAGWSAGVVLLLMFVLSATEALREGASDDVVNLAGCFAFVHFALIFILVRLYRPDDRLRDALGLRGTNPLHVLLAGVFGAALYPLRAALDERFASAFPIDEKTQESIDRLFDAPTTGTKLALFFAVGVVIPLSEELFFRGALFGALVRGRADVARRLPLVVLASAGYFALAQGDFRGLASSLLLGLAVGWLRARGGSSFLAIVAHVSHLAVPLGPLLHGGDVRSDASFGTRWIIASVATTAVTGLLLALLFRSGAQPRAARAQDEADGRRDAER